MWHFGPVVKSDLSNFGDFRRDFRIFGKLHFGQNEIFVSKIDRLGAQKVSFFRCGILAILQNRLSRIWAILGGIFEILENSILDKMDSLGGFKNRFKN